MILILSNKWDLSVDFVICELRKRKQPYLRLNTEDLPSEIASVTFPNFQILVTKGREKYDLTKCINVIWNRRPGKPYDDVPKSDRPSQAIKHFVDDQWYSWLESLQLIKDVTWINHPHANDSMESKIRQLKLATEIGFMIPETLITNDPNSVRARLEDHRDGLVVKALYSPLIEETAQDYFIFTNQIKKITSDTDKEIRISPSIFQQPILPKTDYRVTVIRNKVFSVKILHKDGSSIKNDWRTIKDNIQFVPCELPKDVEDLCIKYISQSKLLFGAIDFAERNGDFIFLEINPNGEWGWLQKPYGLPIAECLCDLMIYYDNLR